MPRWTSRDIYEWSEEKLPKLSLDELTSSLVDYFKFERCLFCGESMEDFKHAFLDRYLGFKIVSFACPHCETPFLKIYFKNEVLVGVLGHGATSQGKVNYRIFYAFPSSLRYKNPIETSKDYNVGESRKRGRPRKHDFREIDRLILKSLDKSELIKWGSPTRRIWEHVNVWYRQKLSRTIIYERLHDLEIRGLVSKERRYEKWFWRIIRLNVLKKRIDLGFLEEKSKEDFDASKDELIYKLSENMVLVRVIDESDELPWSAYDLVEFSPQEILAAQEDYILGKGLKSEKAKKRRLRKVEKKLEEGYYGKATPWIKEMVVKARKKLLLEK